MDDREMENKIKTAMSHMTPDIKASVMADIEKTERKPLHKGRNRSFRRIVMAAACLALCLSFFTGHFYMTARAVDSVISLDVNPGIIINVNKRDRVISVEALNDEASEVIGSMDLKNTDLDVAVNALIGSMLRNGYIDGLSNSILVSVENGDEKRSIELREQISDIIRGIFDGLDGMDVAVLSQTVNGSDEIKALAERHGITEGKAQLASKIAESSPDYDAEQFAGLSVNDLNLLMSSNRVRIEGAVSTGAASDTSYIGGKAALKIALTDAGVKANEVAFANEKLDYEDGLMIYEVEFSDSTGEYEYEIDALTGKIIDREIEKYSQEQDKKPSGASITVEEAFKAALDDAGRDNIQAGKAELEDDGGRHVYEIDFVSEGVDHEYKVDASTGEIIEKEIESDSDDDDEDDDDGDEDDDDEDEDDD